MEKSLLKYFEAKGIWKDRSLVWKGIDPDVNIIVGINGSGKSTLLNVMYAAINGDVKALKGYGVNSNCFSFTPSKEELAPIYLIRSFDTPITDKRKTESQLLQQLNYVLYQNREGFSFFNYRMRILDEPERAQEIQNHIKELFSVVDEMFMETGKKIEISHDSRSLLLFRKGDKVLHVEDLSSGEKQLLLLLVTVFLMDKQKAILFMDEPEVSLHISWQQVLIDNLKRLNPNCQIVLATHSPSIISLGWGDKVVQTEDLLRAWEI